MRIVIFGGTGNHGTALLRRLALDPAVAEVVAVARRVPKDFELPKVTWVGADVTKANLRPIVAGADAVVHLAWMIQPTRDRHALERVNVLGSQRVFDAVAAERVPALVYASSIGAYSPGPSDYGVDESWPCGGIESNLYSMQKAEVEARLDLLERKHPGLRVVRVRPALTFQRAAAQGIRRLFAGPLLPTPLVHPKVLVAVPDIPDLRTQGVHADDLADAYHAAIVKDVHGPFNVAAEPILDAAAVADELDLPLVPLPELVARTGAKIAWLLHLQPLHHTWLDLGRCTPVMDTTRARTELEWEPSVSSIDALLELLEGIGEGADYPTPPLSSASSGPLRLREFLTGIGHRNT